jgi:FkbM family methyltransferase
VLWQVLIIAEYELEVCRHPRVIIDAGANIGLTSVFFANMYPDAKIVAIEPESTNYGLLLKNIAPYSNIVAVQAALWKESTELALIDSGLGNYGFQTHARRATSQPSMVGYVPSITMNKLMEDYQLDHIDILKIDIEGAEKEVFENAMPWIDQVRAIEVETHDEMKTGCSRAVYLATKDFDLEFRKGETIFLARKEYSGDIQLSSGQLPGLGHSLPSQSKCKLPLKIVVSV